MPWIAGQRLQGGKYVIGQVLGQGGFGITYKALHVELNRQVVIKTPNEYLRHDHEYKKYIERFIREGQTLAQLSQDPHPHIVGVIDLFEEGSTHCLVMNFVSGENLFEAVRRRGALPEDLIVPCICQIGEALMVVHQAGLVHRDAHPGNIMLRSNGKAVLIDFGIAKELLPKTLSSTGNVGNHGFAPYEQITRGSREPTVDVYCLAATLYYAVTGQRPTTSLARKLDNAFLTPPEEIISSISGQLNYAIIKGMALEAKDRPQSMRAWLEMLEVSKAEPPPRVEPVHRKEVVRPKAKSESKTTLHKPATKLTRTIPWGLLTGSLVFYGLIGYLLALSHAPLWVGAWAAVLAAVLAVAMGEERNAMAEAGTARAVTWAMGVAMAIAGPWAMGVAGAVAGAEAGAWVMACAMSMAGTLFLFPPGDKLEQSFSKFHTFLILAGTSGLGLSLERLVRWFLTQNHTLLKL